MSKVENTFKEFMQNAGPMVPDRLAECADKHGLDFERLYDWAEKHYITQGLLENVEDGSLDVVEFEDEPSFKMNEDGKEKAEAILKRSPEGRKYLREVKKAHKEHEQVLEADHVG